MHSMDAWDAVDTASAIARGEVTRAEVLERAIERAKAAEDLGAIVTPTYERALRSANPTGPLAGVPTFIKDLVQVEGVRTRFGSRAAGSFVSKRSDPIARKLAGIGLVSLGKSATSEFGFISTIEPVGGTVCRNPRAPEHSCGGSSGGAAVLVAKGVVPVAHASDGGGSIRIPAACCGVVGFKPSRHRLDMAISPLLPVNIATDGVITRNVGDTVAVFNALESRYPSRRVRPIGRPARRPHRRLRIGWFVDAPTGTTVDAEVCEEVRLAAERCKALGHHVEAIPCPFPGRLLDDFLFYWYALSWGQTRTARLLIHGGWDASQHEPFTEGLATAFRQGPVRTFEAVGRLRRAPAVYRDAMDGFDILLSPTVAHPAPKLGHLATDLPFEVTRDRLRAFVPFTPIHNAAGAPAISLPLGESRQGLPIGVQFAARPGDDRQLLELAFEVEAQASS